MSTADKPRPVEGIVGHDDPYAEHERQLIEILDMIRRDYEKAAKPYLERLARIRCMRQPTVTISKAQAISLGLVPNAN